MVELSLYPMYNRRNLNGLDFRPCMCSTNKTYTVYSIWQVLDIKHTYLPPWNAELVATNGTVYHFWIGFPSHTRWVVFLFFLLFSFTNFTPFLSFLNSLKIVSVCLTPPISLPNLAIVSKNQMIILACGSFPISKKRLFYYKYLFVGKKIKI